MAFGRHRTLDFVFVWGGMLIDKNNGGASVMLNLASSLSEKYRVGVVMVRDVRSFIHSLTRDPLLQEAGKKSLPYRLFNRVVASKPLYLLALKLIRRSGRETILDSYSLDRITIILTDGRMKRLRKTDTKVMISNSWETAWVVNSYDGPVKHKLQILQYGVTSKDLEDYVGPIAPHVIRTMDFDMDLICINKIDYTQYPDRKKILLKLGIDRRVFYNDQVAAKSEDSVLFVLRKHREKGAEYALDAARLIAERFPGLRMTAYGDYQVDSLPPYINYRGRVTTEQLRHLYAESEIFVFPSVGEGFGLTGLEAMACGCAVVAASNDGIREYMVDGKNSLIVSPGSAPAILDGVERLLSDRKLLKTIASGGEMTAKEFDSPQMAKTLLEGLESLYGEGWAK